MDKDNEELGRRLAGLSFSEDTYPYTQGYQVEDSTERFYFPEQQQQTNRQVENMTREYQGIFTHENYSSAAAYVTQGSAYPNRDFIPSVEYMTGEYQGRYTYPAAQYPGEGSSGSLTAGYGDIFAYPVPSSDFSPYPVPLNYTRNSLHFDGPEGSEVEENVRDLSLRVRDLLLCSGSTSRPAYNPEYTVCYSHGTTVMWVRYSKSKIDVAVDSQVTDVYTVPTNTISRRVLETLGDRNTKKFISIPSDDGEIYATLAGHLGRCLKMVEYVKKKMPQSFADACYYASRYFRKNPLSKKNKDRKGIVFLCGWIKAQREYDVIKVGDEGQTPLRMNDSVFGAGQIGYRIVESVMDREQEGSREHVKLVNAMVEAPASDPYTGGPINVYSLEDGECQHVHSESLLDKFYARDKRYEEMFYKDRMIVFTEKQDLLNFTANDLLLHIQSSIYEYMSRDDITWLLGSDTHIVYLVRFPLDSEYCTKWYAMGSYDYLDAYIDSDEKLVKGYSYQNLDMVESIYYFGHASAALIEVARLLSEVTPRSAVYAASEGVQI